MCYILITYAPKRLRKAFLSLRHIHANTIKLASISPQPLIATTEDLASHLIALSFTPLTNAPPRPLLHHAKQRYGFPYSPPILNSRHPPPNLPHQLNAKWENRSLDPTWLTCFIQLVSSSPIISGLFLLDCHSTAAVDSRLNDRKRSSSVRERARIVNDVILEEAALRNAIACSCSVINWPSSTCSDLSRPIVYER